MGLARTDRLEPLDPYNAFTRSCDVRGDATGPLAGIRVGIKDHLRVAGVPLPDGETPAEHTEMVRRLLDAGAVIVAKTSMGSTQFGATTNPRDTAYSPGYSSAGSGAAVAAGLVDIAVGTDGAGSVRIPAAWCGIVAMKPSLGVLPVFEAQKNPDLSTAGPMTATVAENVTMLEVLSGFRDDYGRDIGRRLTGIRVGVVAEGKPSTVQGPQAIGDAADAAARLLEDRGASVVPVSVPSWPDAADIIFKLMGLVDTMPLSDAEHGRSDLKAEIGRALAVVDVLLTPTTVVPHHRLDGQLPDAVDEASTRLLALQIRNTCPVNLTGHPALSVPGGADENGLPIGIQLIGRPLDEATLYRLGSVIEGGAW